jgi:CubicO group peptidase (beta-lactamase class C family)
MRSILGIAFGHSGGKAPGRAVLVLAAITTIACAPAPAVRPAPVAPQPAPAASTGAPAPDPRAELEAKLDPVFADFTRGKSPGCAVGVYRAGEIVFSKGYGYADLEHDELITDATPFYTASLSKQFTAAAVLLLVQDGKISLSDDVHKFIPELGNFGAPITIDELIHHTSGLRDYHLLLFLDGRNEEDVITSHEVLWLISHQRGLNFPPGVHFSYSSSGYVLLAEIVARVSGESFGSFLSKRVLKPLGMTSSLLREDHARLIPHRALGYTVGEGGQIRSLMGNLEYDGSSNFVTTIRDLARWDQNFYVPSVGGPTWLDAMRVRGKLVDGQVLEYAAGLEETVDHGRRVEEHDGGFAGYRSVLVRYLDERLTVGLLCNTTEADPYAFAEKVGAALLAPHADGVAPPPPKPAPFGFDLAEVTGRYVDLSTAEVRTVEVTGGAVEMRYSGPKARPRKLVAVGTGELAVESGKVHYAYEPAKGAQPARLVRSTATGEASHALVRLPPPGGDPPLFEYVGRYGGEELAHDLEIRVEGGALVAAPAGGPTRAAAFRPIARDLFVSPDIAWKIADDVGFRFERDARGKVVRLVASIDRAREVVLTRRATVTAR